MAKPQGARTRPTAGQAAGTTAIAGRSADREDTTRTYYEERAADYAHATQSADLTPLWQEFEAALFPGAAVGDLGCGAGRDLRRFAGSGLAPVGMDRSFTLCRIAHAFSGCPVVVGDLVALPFRAQVFDGIWCAAALLHLSPTDARIALAEMNRALRPGGVAMVTLKERSQDGLQDEVDETGRRTFFYSENAVRDALRRARLTDVRLIRSVEQRGRRSISWMAFFARNCA